MSEHVVRRCKWCGRESADIHEIQEARGWPGEHVCRNILDCATRQREAVPDMPPDTRETG